MDFFRKIYTYAGFLPREAYIWIAGLAALAVAGPGTESHFSVCILSLLDLHICPGCGLGRSVAYILRGDFYQGWHTHYLGFFAIIILSYRIISLFIKTYINAKSITTPA